MTALNPRILLVAMLCVGGLGHQTVDAQAVSELPRAEYYLAKELFGAGRMDDAAVGFEAALAVARRVGNERWVDSIPPLVMLGECYYQKGNLRLALEQYETALGLLLAFPSWIDEIEVGVDPLPALENLARGPSWFARNTASTPVAIPEGVQIAIDPTQAIAAPDGSVVAPISLVTRLDVTEILKTTGMAMLRRAQILGPLAENSNLAIPLRQQFARTPRQPVPWILASWSVLRGISEMSGPPAGDAAEKLRSGALIQGRFDYFMSPLALLLLGQQDARDGKYQAAIANLQDAALLAAIFEQHELLAESLYCLSSCCAASSRTDQLGPLQAAATWCSKRSPYSQLTATVGAAELAVLAGNLPLADKLVAQSSVGLRARDIQLPRVQARAYFVLALLGFAQDRGSQGLSNLDSALTLMRGSVQTGPSIERVFQAQQALDLYSSGGLSAADTEKLLTQVLGEPGADAWQNAPLETLAAMTTASIPAYERWLQLAVGRQDNPEILARMDRLQRQWLYEALPLGGRLLSWRVAAASDPQILPAEVRQTFLAASQRTPDLENRQKQIRTLLESLRQGPLPLDERQLSADLKKTYSQLDELSGSYESLLAFHSLSRIPLARFVPEPLNLQLVQQQLAAGDLVLGWVATSSQIFGAAINQQSVEVWQVAEADSLRSQLERMLVEIGLVRTQAGYLPAAATLPTAAWRTTAADIEQRLLPSEVESMIENANRVIVAPNAQLWYLPFELLPEQGQADANPWMAKRQVCYVPTMGSISAAFSSQPDVQDTIGLIGNLFALDKELNKQQADLVAAASPNTTTFVLAQKNAVPNSHWLRIRAGQVWVAAAIDGSQGWNAVPIPLDKSQPMRLGSWMQTPQAAPARVLLPGFQTSMQSGALQNGNDIFLPACALLYGGSRSAILSRWSAGGRSSARLMARCLEEFKDEPPSAALRRSCLALWTEEFPTADEPILLPASKEASVLTSGAHPLLWSGYMCLGDSAP